MQTLKQRTRTRTHTLF